MCCKKDNSTYLQIRDILSVRSINYLGSSLSKFVRSLKIDDPTVASFPFTATSAALTSAFSLAILASGASSWTSEDRLCGLGSDIVGFVWNNLKSEIGQNFYYVRSIEVDQTERTKRPELHRRHQSAFSNASLFFMCPSPVDKDKSNQPKWEK